MANRVLVIDDDPECCYYLAEGLREAGYEVEEADGAATGLDMVQHASYDLIVTDIVMPDREGTSLIVELRRRYPEIKIIAVSGAGKTAFVDYLNMAEKVGAHRALAKPVDLPFLATCVADLIGPAATAPS
jgi:CheY-like chemotaxis protein